VGWFESFDTAEVPTSTGTVHARIGGAGPPLLCLHGYPQTHLMWRDAAPLLARSHRVVVCDLPGYGHSSPPPNYDKRTVADQLSEAMLALGHERFAVAGHDRGGRVAYRMALDRPATVTHLAVLDIIPTLEVWERIDAASALGYWHWPFLAQPAPLPESLILGAPDAFFDHGALGLADPARTPPEVSAAYRAAFRDPAIVHAFCEDYRAGAGVDRDHDRRDRERGHRITAPVLALWGSRGGLERWYDVLAIWRRWAERVEGGSIDATHFLVEDRPHEVSERLLAFLED
jgi:haloacetate dehalogenase